MIVLKCKCQLGVHALDFPEKDEKELLELLARQGQYKKITVLGGKSWKVPIAWILFHGIKADEIETYGFEEWDEQKTATDS